MKVIMIHRRYLLLSLIATTTFGTIITMEKEKEEKTAKKPRIEKKSTKLLNDAQAGPLDIELIKKYISDGGDTNIVDQNGFTLMHFAAAYGQQDIMQLLLANKARIDAANNNEEQPIHIAVRSGNPDTVEWLIDHGASVHGTSADTQPIHLAIERGQAQTVRVLIQNSADINCRDVHYQQPIHNAARNGHAEIVSLLLENGADVNALEFGNQQPLHGAAMNRHTDTVRLLLENGADINATDEYPEQAMHWAIRNNDTLTMIALLEHRPDFSLVPEESRNIETIILLFERSAELSSIFPEILEQFENLINDIRLSSDLPPLTISLQGIDISFTLAQLLKISIRANNSDWINIILKNATGLTTNNITTGLRDAAASGHIQIVEILKDYMHRHDTMQDHLPEALSQALSRATTNGHYNVVQYLIANNALTLDNAETALLAAAYNGHKDILVILRQNMQRTDTMHGHLAGILPRTLREAAVQGHTNVVEYLIMHEQEIDLRVACLALRDLLSPYLPLEIAANPNLQRLKRILNTLVERQLTRRTFSNPPHTPLNPESLQPILPVELIGTILALAVLIGLRECAHRHG